MGGRGDRSQAVHAALREIFCRGGSGKGLEGIQGSQTGESSTVHAAREEMWKRGWGTTGGLGGGEMGEVSHIPVPQYSLEYMPFTVT